MITAPRSTHHHNWLRILVPLVAVAAVLVLAAVYTRSLRAPHSPANTNTQIIHIQPGMGLGDIATALARAGYLRSPVAFQIYALLHGQAHRLQSGYYQLSPDMSAPQIIDLLSEGRQAVATLTVPEGLTLSEVAVLSQKVLFADTEQFRAASTAQAVEESLQIRLPSTITSAEGYLFPETYQFQVGIEPQRIVAQMIEEFRTRFVAPLWQATPPAQCWGSLHEVVTLASLIEEEAQVDKERPLIAGVLLNRLRAGMKLQCDATVQYALPERKGRLTHEDLKIQSPYNTYLHQGLPPGPICNPGLASLQAALKPATTGYMYYVARGDGTHIFSQTYGEHQAAIRRIRGAGAR